MTLINTQVKQRRKLERAVVDAVEREHKQFANDLHDGICQELAGIAMTLDAMIPSLAAVAAMEIRSVADHIRRVTLDTQRLALGLAPIVVERAGLAGALALFKLDLEALKGPEITVSVDERVVRTLPLDMAVNLYRIAQEATANALRHSDATHIDIAVENSVAGLLLVIQDDGRGIPDRAQDRRGLGIRSMVSRAEWLGGQICLSARLPRGTRVQVIVPWVVHD